MHKNRQYYNLNTSSIVALIASMLLFSFVQAQDSLNVKPVKPLTQKERAKATRDSLKTIRDSIRLSKPLILETYIVPDSLKFKRIILWSHNQYLNSISLLNPDTTYNDNFNDNPVFKKDVGATYLGISGSASQAHNYFNREELKNFKAFSPYLDYSYTPETLPFYNVKTPYTELAYFGTLFATREKEESNIKFLHTQNISPSFNFSILYKRYGGKGLLKKEATDNRTFSINFNYIGTKYVLHGGYLSNSIKREENGGVLNEADILDTLIDVRTISVALQDAKTKLKRNTFFFTHSYGIPIRFTKDSIKYGEGTIAYIGHTFEYSTYSRTYRDLIPLTEKESRDYYKNNFFIDPTTSYDSTRVSSFENRAFIRIQPWAKEAIVSKLDGGIGYQILSIYGFRPEFYLEKTKNIVNNNLYIYAGASGQFKSYFNWDAVGRYDISGYYANDFNLEGKLKFSIYPNKEGVHLSAKLLLSNTSPDWYENSYYSNHFVWQNNFSKTTQSKLEGILDIPKYKFQAFFGYSLISNKVYYDTLGIVRQNGEAINIMSAYAKKNFKLGILHLDNRILFQISSNQNIIPLPTLSLNLRYYLEFNVVKKVLRTQLGADVTFNSAYYAQSYSPATGQFHNQIDRKIGNNPYIDLFANLQWKRASIFIKYINAAQGWPQSDYFSANQYIRPQTAIKFGIHWPFYVK